MTEHRVNTNLLRVLGAAGQWYIDRQTRGRATHESVVNLESCLRQAAPELCHVMAELEQVDRGAQS